MRQLTKYFFQGLLIVVPLVLTTYLVYQTIVLVDQWMQPVLGWIGLETAEEEAIPGVGLGVLILLTTGIGMLASNFLGRWILTSLDAIVDRVPLVRLIYGSIKDLLGAFVGDKKSFDKPVLVELYQGCAGKVLGFITRDELGTLQMSDHVAVYFPQSYNFAGQVLVVPADSVTRIDVDAGDLMAFIVSGGVAKSADHRVHGRGSKGIAS